MALEKTSVIDQITVTENAIVLCRTATRILEDGQIISQTYQRTSFVPGQDVSDQPSNVQAICAAAWTPEVVSAYQASQQRPSV